MEDQHWNSFKHKKKYIHSHFNHVQFLFILPLLRLSFLLVIIKNFLGSLPRSNKIEYLAPELLNTYLSCLLSHNTPNFWQNFSSIFGTKITMSDHNELDCILNSSLSSCLSASIEIKLWHRMLVWDKFKAATHPPWHLHLRLMKSMPYMVMTWPCWIWSVFPPHVPLGLQYVF